MDNIERLLIDLPLVDKEKLMKSIDENGIMSTVLKWGNNVSTYQNMVAAGRIYMKHKSENFAKSIDEYVTKLKDWLSPEIIDFLKEHEDVLQKEVDARKDNDLDVDWLAAGTFIKTYFARTKIGNNPVESMQYLWLRVATQLYYDSGIDDVIKCYRELSDRHYIHASPTLFNAGMVVYKYEKCGKCKACIKKFECENPKRNMMPKSQMSSCFLMTTEDNTESILKSLEAIGKISKGNGASGVDVSLIRHSELGNRGYTKGLMPLLYLYNANVRYFDQEGMRKGAATISTRSHHIDLEAFCEASLKTGNKYERVHQINTSIWFSALFWKRVEENGYWTLFCPKKTQNLNYIYGVEFIEEYEKYEKKFMNDPSKTKYYKRVPARVLLAHITKCQYKSGMPYIMHGDSCNYKSNQKNLGFIRTSNLCQEIIEYSNSTEIASCNLMSQSVKSFVLGKTGNLIEDFDWQKHANITHSCVRNLNRVIDKNICVMPEIKRSNDRHRPLGIGVTGFADALYKMDIHFEHPLAFKFNKMFFASLYFNALVSSVQESLYYGPYESFKGSPASQGKLQFDLWAEEYKLYKKHGLLGRKPLRKPEDDLPIEPNEWKQKPFKLSNGDIIQPTWEDLKRCIIKYGLRNSLFIALMPSATTANVQCDTETTEAPMTCLYDRRLMNGNYTVLNKHLERDLRELSLWNKYTTDLIDASQGSICYLDKFVEIHKEFYPEFKSNENTWKRLKYLQTKYKTMWELKMRNFMKLSAERGRYICQSQSFNIYMSEPTTKKLMAAHITGYKYGLKTGMYYLRASPPREASKITVDPVIIKFVEKHNPKSITNLTSNKKKKRWICTDEICISCN